MTKLFKVKDVKKFFGILDRLNSDHKLSVIKSLKNKLDLDLKEGRNLVDKAVNNDTNILVFTEPINSRSFIEYLKEKWNIISYSI